MDDLRPGDVYRETGRWFGPVLFAALAVMAIGLVLTLVGWQAGWWFAAQNANREAHIIRNGYSNQQTLRDQITSKLADVESVTTEIAAAGSDKSLITALRAQRMGIAEIVCGDVSQVTGDPLPSDQAAWAAANCRGGTVSPGSPFYQASTP